LARLLSVAGVTHIYASELERTRATVAPLARQLGLGISVVAATEPERQVELLRALDDHAVALVAGHSNTLPILAKGLGAELDRLDSRGYLPDNAYDRVFVLVPHESGRVELLELRACEPSSQ
jgi:phosphohistidine phosphatase SixA